jgi:hypothetical protein
MKLRNSLIAMAIVLVAENTNYLRKSDDLEVFLNRMFGLETPEEKLAREINEGVDVVVDTVKRVSTNRKFKKIVTNMEVSERES